MSCDGWEIGDRCEALSDFEVEHSRGGGLTVVQILAGDVGVVRGKYDDHPVLHKLEVAWQRLGRALTLNHSQMHMLRRI